MAAAVSRKKNGGRRGCPTRKARWPTESKAEQILQEAQIRHAIGAGPRRREVRVYECPMCQGWHLTSKG